MSDEIRATLNERNSNYGKFMDNAVIAVRLQTVVEATEGYKNLQPDQIIALQLIFQKIGRALSGDAQYDDNWRDIAGYAQLIVDRINGTGCYASGQAEPQITRRVTDADTRFTIGSVRRCGVCYAKLGDVHAPNCSIGKDPSPPR